MRRERFRRFHQDLGRHRASEGRHLRRRHPAPRNRPRRPPRLFNLPGSLHKRLRRRCDLRERRPRRRRPDEPVRLGRLPRRFRHRPPDEQGRGARDVLPGLLVKRPPRILLRLRRERPLHERARRPAPLAAFDGPDRVHRDHHDGGRLRPLLRLPDRGGRHRRADRLSRRQRAVRHGPRRRFRHRLDLHEGHMPRHAHGRRDRGGRLHQRRAPPVRESRRRLARHAAGARPPGTARCRSRPTSRTGSSRPASMPPASRSPPTRRFPFPVPASSPHRAAKTAPASALAAATRPPAGSPSSPAPSSLRAARRPPASAAASRPTSRRTASSSREAVSPRSAVRPPPASAPATDRSGFPTAP